MNSIDLNTLLNAEIGDFSFGKIISALAVLIVCLFLKKLINKAVKKIIQKSKMNKRLTGIVEKTVDIIIVFLIIILTASTLGVNTSSIIALATALSLGVTLAMNDILANFAGGIVMLSAKIFNPGDFIEVNGVSGTVTDMRLSHTRIRTLDNQVITIPNKDISSSVVTSYTANPTRRCGITVTASYDSTTEDVKKALLEAASEDERVLQEPAPNAVLTNFGDSSIGYALYFWTATADHLPTKAHVMELIREKFAKYGVEMDYNHLNVHML